MSVIDTLIEKMGYVSKTKSAIPNISSAGGSDPFAIWRGNKRVDPEKAFQAYSGWVYACIRAIAEEIEKMRFKLIVINAKDGTEEEVYDHEILDLLEGVNPTQTGMELRYTMAAHLEAVGNAYIYLDGVKDEKGKPTALYLLDASRTKVLVNRDDFPATILGYQYRTSTHNYEFKTGQVIHLKYPDPADPYEGIGTVQASAQWIDADNYAMEFNRRYFLNGARVGGILEAQQAYTTDQLEYMKKSFENSFKGVDNAHKILALPQNVKYIRESDGQKDMDFSNLSTMMRDRILAAFRVPRTALGITDDVNRANAEATDYVFAARTIKPKMELICSYLNEFLVPRYGDNIYLTFEDPVPENRELLIQEMTAALGTAPSMSVNEAREKFLGLPPIVDGDAVMSPFNLTPLGVPEKKGMSKNTIKGPRTRKRHKSIFSRTAELRRTVANDMAKSIAESLKIAAKKVKAIKKKKNIATLSDDEFEPIYKSMLSRVMPYEDAMKKTIKKFNDSQKEEVLGNASQLIKSFNKKTKTIDDSALFDYESSVTAMVDLATPLLSELFAHEGAEAAALLGFSFDALTPEVKKALDKAIQLMSSSYNQETLALLKAKLEQGIQLGLSLEELQATISDVYVFSDQVRAARVARTEVFRVANESTKEAWKQTGVVKTIKWYTAEDERVCPLCAPMNGKVVSIEENFYNKGDIVKGSDGSEIKVEYADISAGSLHVNCRCYTRPDIITLD